MYKLQLPPLTLNDIRRFWAFVNKTDTCWLWTGGRMGGRKERYRRPSFRVGEKCYIASRISYLIHFDIDPLDKEVAHDCNPNEDNPLCVNPDHLWLCTHQQNAKDYFLKGGLPSLGGSKLTHQQRKEIQYLYDQGIGVNDIANHYRIHRRTVWFIAKRKIL